MRAAQIKNNAVENILEVTSLDALPDLLPAIGANGRPAEKGDTWDGQSFVPAPVVNPALKEYEVAVQRHLDANAQRLGYDSIFTASTYAGEIAAPKYSAEGMALRAWRSQVWMTAEGVQDEVTAETRPAPTIDELIALLPACPL